MRPDLTPPPSTRRPRWVVPAIIGGDIAALVGAIWHLTPLWLLGAIVLLGASLYCIIVDTRWLKQHATQQEALAWTRRQPTRSC